MASRVSVFSICYAHGLVPHRIFCWTTYSEDLYIVDCPVLCCRASESACSLIRCSSSSGVTRFTIIRSYNVYVWHKLFGIAESFPGFNMAIIFDCLQKL